MCVCTVGCVPTGGGVRVHVLKSELCLSFSKSDLL